MSGQVGGKKEKSKVAEILQEIEHERSEQDSQWGGASHDDKHNSHDWIAIITKHVGKAVVWPWDAFVFRKQVDG